MLYSHFPHASSKTIGLSFQKKDDRFFLTDSNSGFHGWMTSISSAFSFRLRSFDLGINYLRV